MSLFDKVVTGCVPTGLSLLCQVVPIFGLLSCHVVDRCCDTRSRQMGTDLSRKREECVGTGVPCSAGISIHLLIRKRC